MKFLNLQVTGFIAGVLFTQSAMAQPSLVPEDEALKNFKEAAKMYRENDNAMESMEDMDEGVVEMTSDEALLDDEGMVSNADSEDADEIYTYSVEDASMYESHADDATLESANVQINIENKTLEEILSEVLLSASNEVGEWEVKWRLSPENNYIRDERVNITAETTLGGFMTYLTDRVNNMTGVQLFVTVFNKAHIIVISDTYY